MRPAHWRTRLGYIPTNGTPGLREAIAATYDHATARTCWRLPARRRRSSGRCSSWSGPGDHAIVTAPNYQSMESIPLAAGVEVTGLPIWRGSGSDLEWALDLDRLVRLLRPNTRLVAVNFPNNPTGFSPPPEVFVTSFACATSAGSGSSATRSTAGSRWTRPDAPAGGRPLSDGDLAQRDVQGVRAAGAPGRMARLSRPRAAGSAGTAQALQLDLRRRSQRIPGHDRAPARRRRPGAQPGDHRGEPAPR